jgi:ATP-dependent Clp protease, protease subunit
MNNPTQPVSAEIYATFGDQINQGSVQRIFQNIAAASQNGVTQAHILFQSTGGFVGDGICLYNFFKTLPIELTLYNAGSVMSIGTIAFLGAAHRRCSTHALFQIHRSAFSSQPAPAAQLEALAEAAHLDDMRTEAILRAHIKISDEQWRRLNSRDLHFCGPEAVTVGFADEVGDFHPPPGATLYNI